MDLVIGGRVLTVSHNLSLLLIRPYLFLMMSMCLSYFYCELKTLAKFFLLVEGLTG